MGTAFDLYDCHVTSVHICVCVCVGMPQYSSTACHVMEFCHDMSPVTT